MIPESDDSVTECIDLFGACDIQSTIHGMLTSINFNNQMSLRTAEIDDIFPDWMLAPKLQPFQVMTAKVGPEADFSVR